MDFIYGKNSVINLGATSAETQTRITIRCGENCIIDIAGIDVINTKLYIFANNNAVLKMGKGQLINGFVNINMHEKSRLSIGDNCLFAECSIWTSDMHSVIDKVTNNRVNPAQDIHIGRNVWIGHQALILKGSTILDGCIVAARATITSSTARQENSVLAGNPARIVRKGVSWDLGLHDVRSESS